MSEHNPPPDPAPTEWQSRCNLARSILNHREPCARTVDLARAALDGATVQDLLDLERIAAGIGDL